MKGKPTRKKDSRLRRRKRQPPRAGELAALAALADDRIDTGDIPETRDWSGAKRGLFYRALKQQLTLRLDADVVAWFRRRAKGGRGYQTDINRALRDHVRKHDKAAVR